MFVLPIATIIAFVTAVSDAHVCSNKGNILGIDLEWVLQGYQMGFSGFFVEYLGISSALRDLVPNSRMIKSSFKDNFKEPIFVDDQINFELFKKEHDALSQLTSGKPKVQNNPLDLPACRESQRIEHDYVYREDILAKGIENVSDWAECCGKCQQHLQCLSWSFVPDPADGHFVSKYNHEGGNCFLSGKQERTGFSMPGGVSGRILPVKGEPIKRQAPRAIVYHGTTCIHQNQTVSAATRDINTILFGRYMLERPAFRGGYTLDEYAVMYCAARMDELWVPTEWHKEVFLRILAQQGSMSSAPLITVIPEAVDTELFDPAFVPTDVDAQGCSLRSSACLNKLLAALPEPQRATVIGADGSGESDISVVVKKKCFYSGTGVVECEAPNQRFEFLSVFKWEYRKGWDVLLNAYWTAFSREDNVVLRLRTYLPFSSGGDRNITRQVEMHAEKEFGRSASELAKVVWEVGTQGIAQMEDGMGGAEEIHELTKNRKETTLTREDIRDLLASADAFVLPTRGEGWGLPIAEAMSMTLPVIVTNHSGPAAYCSEQNAYLIPVKEHTDDLAFAVPDEEALALLLRQVVHESSESGGYRAQLKGLAARRTMQEISPESIVCKINERIRYHAERRGYNFP